VSAETAYLVPRDDPSALATALRRVLADREFAVQRATAALHRLMTHFRPEPWVERYLAVYARASRRQTPVPC
jgi:glycosyltransferase involved in cell wall biosynthesis